jgi:hypothetical protein
MGEEGLSTLFFLRGWLCDFPWKRQNFASRMGSKMHPGWIQIYFILKGLQMDLSIWVESVYIKWNGRLYSTTMTIKIVCFGMHGFSPNIYCSSLRFWCCEYHVLHCDVCDGLSSVVFSMFNTLP